MMISQTRISHLSAGQNDKQTLSFHMFPGSLRNGENDNTDVKLSERSFDDFYELGEMLGR